MYIFYIIAAIYLLIGGVFWYKSSKIAWWEWAAGGAAGFLVAVIFQITAFASMTADTETHSGFISRAHYQPAWTEAYQITHKETYTTGTGKNKVTHTRTWVTHHTQFHPEDWDASDTLGRTISISRDKYQELLGKFKGRIESFPGTRTVWHHERSRMTSGDPNDYAMSNNGYIEPVTTWKMWTNRVKACPSVWSFPTPPEKAEVFDYPKNDDTWVSDRLLGTAAGLGTYEWDQLNARLGDRKKINLIAIGYGKSDASIAQIQRAKWIGGKKNDLVICFGGDTPAKASWVEVFGWTESELCKQNLKTIFLENNIDRTIIPKVEAEVIKNYEIKDWSKFDYLTVEPPTWAYIVFFIVVTLVQGGLGAWFYFNEFDAEGTRYGR